MAVVNFGQMNEISYSTSSAELRDIYTFSVNQLASMTNVGVYDISGSIGGDVDLYLYRDNGDGILDFSNDLLLNISLNDGSDSIHFFTEPGEYHVMVQRDSLSGSNNFQAFVGPINYTLDISVDQINLETIPSSFSNYLDIHFEERVYPFILAEASNINLNLHNISVGDDADLRLYEDTNNNGVFDSADQELAVSRRAGNEDDSINLSGNATGTYFAMIERYADGSQDRLDYELDLSATPSRPYPTIEAPNLLPKEYDDLINVNHPQTTQSISRTGWIGDSNTSDTHHFVVTDYWLDGVGIDISLSGLSSDADVRLIEDRNRNQIVDAGEIIGSSTLGGSFNESFYTVLDGSELAPGYDYFVQVYQYSGNTNYQLDMTVTSTLL